MVEQNYKHSQHSRAWFYPSTYREDTALPQPSHEVTDFEDFLNHFRPCTDNFIPLFRLVSVLVGKKLFIVCT